MSVGLVLYVSGLAVTLFLSTRAAIAYSEMLRSREGAGLLGYDRGYTNRFVLNPLMAWREGVLSRGWRLFASKHSDEALDRLRRSCAVWTVATLGWALLRLVLL